MLSRRAISIPEVTWWTRIRGQQFTRHEIAGRGTRVDATWARSLLQAQADDADWIEYSDASSGVFRGVLLEDGRLDGVVFVSSRPDLPARTWLSGLFARDRIHDADRAALLTGQPLDRSQDAGPIVCACFGVGRKTICDAIERDRLTTPQAIGKKLRAGTNCGSCVAELRGLITAGR